MLAETACGAAPLSTHGRVSCWALPKQLVHSLPRCLLLPSPSRMYSFGKIFDYATKNTWSGYFRDNKEDTSKDLSLIHI